MILTIPERWACGYCPSACGFLRLLPVRFITWLNRSFLIPIVTSVLLTSCASVAKTTNKSQYIDSLPLVDREARVLSVSIEADQKLYADGDQVYTLMYVGMQKRPVLTNIDTGKKRKGVSADNVLAELKPLTPSSLNAVRLSSGCSNTTGTCYLDADHRRLYLFADSGMLLEIVELSESAVYSSTAMRSLLGDSVAVEAYNNLLQIAFDNDDRTAEDKLIASLGVDLDTEALYRYTKAERHRNLFIKSLRQANSYAAYIKAYETGKDVSDLISAFKKREDHTEMFVGYIDRLSVSEAAPDTASAIRSFNEAADIISMRVQIVRANEQKAREAEALRIEQEKDAELRRIAREKRTEEMRLAQIESRKKAAERQRQARERAAALLEKRRKNIGKPVTWQFSKRIDSDDCAALFGVPVICLWVTYNYAFSGEIVSVDESKKSYVARVDQQELLVPSMVSAKYIQMKNKALGWGAKQVDNTFFVPYNKYVP